MKLRNKLAAIRDAAFLVVACIALAIYACTHREWQESLFVGSQPGGVQWVLDDGDTAGYGCEE